MTQSMIMLVIVAAKMFLGINWDGHSAPTIEENLSFQPEEPATQS